MNIIVCFSWLGNNSLSEKQVLFLLQLHILGLVFRKVRHRTLRRAVTGALFLLFQCLLRCVFLDVLCMGGGGMKKTQGWAGRHVLQGPQSWPSPREVRAFLTCLGMVTKARGKSHGRRLWTKRGEAAHLICREQTTHCTCSPELPAAVASQVDEHLPDTRVRGSRPPCTLAARHGKAGRRPGRRVVWTGLQFSRQAALTLASLAYPYGCAPPNLQDWGCVNPLLSYHHYDNKTSHLPGRARLVRIP